MQKRFVSDQVLINCIPSAVRSACQSLLPGRQGRIHPLRICLPIFSIYMRTSNFLTHLLPRRGRSCQTHLQHLLRLRPGHRIPEQGRRCAASFHAALSTAGAMWRQRRRLPKNSRIPRLRFSPVQNKVGHDFIHFPAVVNHHVLELYRRRV